MLNEPGRVDSLLRPRVIYAKMQDISFCDEVNGVLDRVEYDFFNLSRRAFLDRGLRILLYKAAFHEQDSVCPGIPYFQEFVDRVEGKVVLSSTLQRKAAFEEYKNRMSAAFDILRVIPADEFVPFRVFASLIGFGDVVRG